MSKQPVPTNSPPKERNPAGPDDREFEPYPDTSPQQDEGPEKGNHPDNG